MTPKDKKPTPVRTVWEDLYDDPAKAAIMRVRSDLMIGLTEHIKARKWSKAVAAKRCGVTVPRLSELLRGSVTRCAADDLIGMVATAGLALGVEVRSAGTPASPIRARRAAGQGPRVAQPS